LLPFAGYVVEKITRASDIAQVTVRWDRRFRLACLVCDGTMARSRTKTQTARDLGLGTARLVVLTYEAIQGRCSSCGCWATIHPPGIKSHRRATRRVMHFVCRLARHMPLSHIPETVAVSGATAGHWDRKVLREQLPEPDFDDLRIIPIDERAVLKHHGYVTLVMNGVTGELLCTWPRTRRRSASGVSSISSATSRRSESSPRAWIGPGPTARWSRPSCKILDYLFFKLRQESLDLVLPK